MEMQQSSAGQNAVYGVEGAATEHQDHSETRRGCVNQNSDFAASIQKLRGFTPGMQPAAPFPGRTPERGFERNKSLPLLSGLPPHRVRIGRTSELARRRMSSCWSCWVILEHGVTVCPTCGADQTRPVQFVDPNLQPAVTPTRVVQKWKLVIVIIVVFAGSLGGILWHSFAEVRISPASQAAEATARSLRNLREALSTYALSTKDTYPTTLIALGDRASLPLQTALIAGYRLEYIPKSASIKDVTRGFVILARPEIIGYLNLRIDESGIVRATQENRPATVWDPPYWVFLEF
jgi:hypothetical protein